MLLELDVLFRLQCRLLSVLLLLRMKAMLLRRHHHLLLVLKVRLRGKRLLLLRWLSMILLGDLDVLHRRLRPGMLLLRCYQLELLLSIPFLQLLLLRQLLQLQYELWLQEHLW